MRKFTSPLEGVRVAAPCPADWEKMVGDERVRYCGQCSLHVYNLSGMTKREAEGLVANAEGRLCVRYYRRTDGSILTRNCPVGLRALKRRVTRIAGAALSAVLGFFAGLGLNFGVGSATTMRHTMGEMAVPQEHLMGVMAQPKAHDEVEVTPSPSGVIGEDIIDVTLGKIAIAPKEPKHSRGKHGARR
jgi:hypothetical protein